MNYSVFIEIELEKTDSTQVLYTSTGVKWWRKEYTEREIQRFIRVITCSSANPVHALSSKIESINYELNSEKNNKSRAKRIGTSENKSKCPFCFKDYQSGRGIKIHKLKCKQAEPEN